jgi:hypothetical protein
MFRLSWHNGIGFSLEKAKWIAIEHGQWGGGQTTNLDGNLSAIPCSRSMHLRNAGRRDRYLFKVLKEHVQNISVSLPFVR